jgi:hypothetical protein
MKKYVLFDKKHLKLNILNAKLRYYEINKMRVEAAGQKLWKYSRKTF